VQEYFIALRLVDALDLAPRKRHVKFMRDRACHEIVKRHPYPLLMTLDPQSRNNNIAETRVELAFIEILSYNNERRVKDVTIQLRYNEQSSLVIPGSDPESVYKQRV
jgi:hypothetical protein